MVVPKCRRERRARWERARRGDLVRSVDLATAAELVGPAVDLATAGRAGAVDQARTRVLAAAAAPDRADGAGPVDLVVAQAAVVVVAGSCVGQERAQYGVAAALQFDIGPAPHGSRVWST